MYLRSEILDQVDMLGVTRVSPVRRRNELYLLIFKAMTRDAEVKGIWAGSRRMCCEDDGEEASVVVDRCDSSEVRL